jgi:hypothetical protein
MSYTCRSRPRPADRAAQTDTGAWQPGISQSRDKHLPQAHRTTRPPEGPGNGKNLGQYGYQSSRCNSSPYSRQRQVNRTAAQFGGAKQPGLGREGGLEDIEKYRYTQYIGIADPYAG